MRPSEPTLALAIDLFNRQAFFECHEVLEDLWRPLPPSPHKTFLQGLLQVGVGYHHWQKSNYTGAKNKLTSGLEKLSSVIKDSHYQCPTDLLPLIASAQADLNRIVEQEDRILPSYPASTISKLELI